MSTVTIELRDEVETLLRELDQPLDRAVRELMITELYRRHSISAGKAAELLDMDRTAFIHYSSRLGIPFFDMAPEEIQREIQRSAGL